MKNMFRVYHTALKKWMFGYDYENLGGFSLFGEVVLMGELNSIPLCDINDLDVMTFSGEYDTADKPIYTNDLFEDKLTGLIGTVKFGRYLNIQDVKDSGGNVGFYVDFNDESIRKDLLFWTKNSAKIGNIYDKTNH